jgi:hypothetical protein
MTDPRPVDALTPTDLARAPVWEFVDDDSKPDETYVHPVSELPVDSLDGRVAATEVTLRNGRRLLALLGDVDLARPRHTRHFLTLSLYVDNAWVSLARYHDVDAVERGPAAVARRLEMQLSEVFPIEYDLSQVAIGDPQAVRGVVSAEPSERLSRAELISLAVDGAV